jgi:hypothetical protein
MRSVVVSFCVAVWTLSQSPAAIVINEIHHNPDVKTEPVEFVELYNTGTNAVSLAGWRFSSGLSYVFPSVSIAAGGYLVVAQNPSALQAKFGVVGALGPFNPDRSSGLSSRGEKLTLLNAAGQLVDEVDYQLGFPWPTVGDAPGYSIELINPNLDNDLGGNWRASTTTATGQTSSQLIAAGSSWKYLKGTNEASVPTTAWRLPGFNDSTWASGGTPIGYGETFIITPLDDMRSNYTSVFIRSSFTVNDPNAFSTLSLEAQYDDGFKVWINGTNVWNQNISTGEVAFDGTALLGEEYATFRQFTLNNPSAYLKPGPNAIAIQAHNVSKNDSSDFFMNVRLLGLTGPVGAGPTPGRINAVFSTNAPPAIRQVEHTPEQPAAGQPVKITAKVTDPDGVSSVILEYQVVNPGNYIELGDPAYTNAANWISLAMNDSGTAGDAAAFDDVFTGLIPGSVQTHRRLIRYRITVRDGGNRSIRVPYVDDPQPNFAYFVYNGVPGWQGAVQPGAAGANGVVVNYSSNVMGRLPTFHLIGKSNTVATATWFSRYGGDLYQWGGALVYDGKVLDHIRYRARGGVWRYSMCKNMWKFDLNRGHDIEMRDNWGGKYSVPWTKLNLGASIQQGDFNHRGEQGMFESLGFRLFNLAGVAAPHTTFCTFRVVDEADEASPTTQYEGDFWGVYLAIEQENGRFLEEHGLPDGNLYKMEGGTGELNNLGPKGPTDKSDLAYLQANYGAATEPWWRTNWNLMSHYSYQTIVQGIHHYDIADGKNYFFYRNPVTLLWETCTWDLDLTWADNMYRSGQTGGDEPLKSRLLDNFLNPGRLPNINVEFRNRVREIRDLLWNSDQAFKLIDEYAALLRGPTNGPTILDADRSMWDYNPKMLSSTYTDNPGSKAGHGRYYQWPNEPGVAKSFDGAIQVMKNYVGYRATNATFSLDTISADNTRPARPTITYTGPSGYPINRLTFRSSNYSGTNPFKSMRWRVGEITDTNSPSYRADEPNKYEIETVWDSGPITIFTPDVVVPADVLRVGSRYRVRVQHTDLTGRNSNWSLPHEFTCGNPVNDTDLISYLRITEIMFNPPPAGYEYIELYNSSSSVVLDLSGVKFTQGIDFTFPQGTTLAPGAYLVLVGTSDIAGFRSYYDLDGSVRIVGPFSGGLNNAGEQLVLRTSAGGTDIVNFNFSDGRGWPLQADGPGHALVLVDSALAGQNNGSGEYAGNWRASTYLRGSPGRADAPPPLTVLLNEIVAHTDFTTEFDSNDWIELYNPTDIPITLGSGWYLSDDGSSDVELKKWAIPPSTVVPARGFATFDEVTGFHNPTNIGFGLSKAGDQVFLSYLPGSAQDRVVDAVSFKAQENDWSLGRYPDGSANWYALTPRTRNTTNAAPPARVVISEIMFHPPDILLGTNLADNSLDEFIEIRNATGSDVPLHNTNGTWRLNGGVEFVFPTNIALAPGGHLLVVNFDPTNASQLTAFKTLYGITGPAIVLGPYNGKLANNSDRIALEKPQHPDGTNDPVSWVIVDEVLYADQSPWPCASDGTGNSLQRLSDLWQGSDPANWASEPPTAARARADLPPGVASITAQPQDRVVATNANISFSVGVCGTPPFTYQWRFNGTDIANATNSTFSLFNVTMANAGQYTVAISNPAGSIISEPAMLVVQIPPLILTHPQPVTAIRDQTASFSVTAGGTPPFGYQWLFNGLPISGQTNSTAVISPVRVNDGGNYSVTVFNTAGSIQSSNALLTVLIPASIIQQPGRATNRLTLTSTNPVVFAPASSTFSVAATGSGPLTYQWRFNGVNLPGANGLSLTVSNVTPAHAGDYTVMVTDSVGPTISQPAALTVLVDPIVIINPVSQSGPAGSSITLSATIIGYPPPFGYEWRRLSTPLSSNTSSDTVTFFTTNLFAVSAANTSTGQYRVVVRNLAKPNGTPGTFATVLLAADADGDGIPDDWESLYSANPTNLNANVDTDGDGMKNWEEYVAGTNPTNALSYLKVESIETTSAGNLAVQLQFNAVSNRTYSVVWSPAAASGPWTAVADVGASGTNRVVQVTDQRPADAPPRFYRLMTPKNP